MRIPKIIHRVWYGPKAIPEQSNRFWEGWQTLNPEWELRTWTDADFCNPTLERLKATCCNPAFKSDIARFEVLASFGGVYVDCDIEPVRPLEPFIGDSTFCIARAPSQCPDTLAMAATHCHPLVMQCIDAMPAAEARARSMNEICWANGPFVRDQIASYRKRHGDDGITLWPVRVWHPEPNDGPTPIRMRYAASAGVHQSWGAWRHPGIREEQARHNAGNAGRSDAP